MIDRLPVTTAVQGLLATLTGKPVGLRKVPIDPTTGKPHPPPYTLLYPLDHSGDDGTLADRGDAAVSDYQAAFVSGPAPGLPDSSGGDAQAQWMADKGRKVVERPVDGSPGYRYPLNIPGINCYQREAREAGGTSDASDAIITSVIRFRFYLETSA
ncbi:hypothetical protein ACFQ0X_43610 [Streptomyces rectiviolaceus]|uniref:Uncharacterized protein n=1 Tax=Streptomyces rectiviolaceus TaxID=332591 RepID=A0ABP6NN68_9ACTN